MIHPNPALPSPSASSLAPEQAAAIRSIPFPPRPWWEKGEVFASLLWLGVFFMLFRASAFAEIIANPEPVSLKTCIAETMANSPLLSFALADVEEKQQGLAAAQKDRLPFFAARYGHTRQPDAITSDNYYHWALSVEQPIYRGKAITTAIAIGRLNVDFARSALRKAKNDLIYQVYQAYFEVLRTGKLEDIARQSLVQLESHLKDAAAFFEAGLIPKNDLLLSDLQVAQARQDLLKAQNDVQFAQSSLNLLMKKNLDSPLAIEDVLAFAPRPITWDELVQKARSGRAEITQADINLDIARHNITLAKSAYLPTVAVTATYLRQGDHPLAEDYPYGSSEVKTIEALASWRFWTWGQNRHREEEARQGLHKARDSRDNLRDSIVLELRQAFLAMQQSEKNIAVTQKAIEQAEENYRISEARYQAQLATSTEVLDAQTLLARAQTNYYNALYDYNLAWAGIDRATGVLADNY